jgi:hypothetical protein
MASRECRRRPADHDNEGAQLDGDSGRTAGVASELAPDTRKRVLEHVLEDVHPDHAEAEVVGVAPAERGHRVGVKAHPRGYLSSASYAVVAVDGERTVTESEPCTGRELRLTLDGGRA